MGGKAPAPAPLPPPPPLPDPPPPPPTPLDAGVRSVRTNVRRRAALAGGRRSTIATSAQGLTTPAATASKTLLGE
jgi:hypothetical protein